MKILRFKDRYIECSGRPHLMGILNLTPDSFSDGGLYPNTASAVDAALEMVENGAAVIDIGGESTRPGARPVSLQEEIKRVVPVIKALRMSSGDIAISIDTTKPEVAASALEAGADIINDISGLQASPELADIAARYNAGLILMHMRGTPATMKGLCRYDNLLEEICIFLRNAAGTAVSCGVPEENIVLDPGIGFAKNTEQNIEIMQKIKKFEKLGFPLLAGPSRKTFIGDITGKSNPARRIWGTAGAVAWLALQRVDFIRVHDVGAMYDVIEIINAVLSADSAV